MARPNVVFGLLVGGCRKKKSAEDVRDEDEDREAADDVEVAVAFVADDVAQQVLESADHELEHLLEVAGILAADLPRHQRKDDAR